jgi:hypothetical protein
MSCCVRFQFQYARVVVRARSCSLIGCAHTYYCRKQKKKKKKAESFACSRRVDEIPTLRVVSPKRRPATVLEAISYYLSKSLRSAAWSRLLAMQMPERLPCALLGEGASGDVVSIEGRHREAPATACFACFGGLLAAPGPIPAPRPSSSPPATRSQTITCVSAACRS